MSRGLSFRPRKVPLCRGFARASDGTSEARPLNMSSAHLLTVLPMFVRDFEDGQDLDQVLLVRELERRTKRDGEPFLNVILGDRTGQVSAKVWDDVDEFTALCA